MSPDHRAQLAAAIAQFQANIRRLCQSVRLEERDRLLAALDPKRARPAAARADTAKPRGRPAATRRTRKPERATRSRGAPASAPPASAPPASAPPAGSEAITEPVQTELPLPGAAGSAAAAAAAAAATAAGSPGSATVGKKRVRWTRETIVDELASWIVSGTALDASFVQRHGPPGLVPAARRIFGRFDAALNVAGLHVAKLYPDGPPGR
jgi:hypothetical protein